jgi:hypothetical protein
VESHLGIFDRNFFDVETRANRGGLVWNKRTAVCDTDNGSFANSGFAEENQLDVRR